MSRVSRGSSASCSSTTKTSSSNGRSGTLQISAIASTRSTTSRPTGRGRSCARSRVSLTIWTCAASTMRDSRIGFSSRMPAPRPGCSASTATSSTTLRDSRVFASSYSGVPTTMHSRSASNVLNCIRARSRRRNGRGLPVPAFAVDHEALQLRGDRLVDRRRRRAAARRDDRVPPGYDERSVDNIGERLSWDETPLRCLHACFLRRSTADEEPSGAPTGRPILEETTLHDRSWKGTVKRSLRRRHHLRYRPGRARSTCAATS